MKTLTEEQKNRFSIDREINEFIEVKYPIKHELLLDEVENDRDTFLLGLATMFKVMDKKIFLEVRNLDPKTRNETIGMIREYLEKQLSESVRDLRKRLEKRAKIIEEAFFSQMAEHHSNANKNDIN